MDDFSMGRVHHVGQPSGIKAEQIWLWHRRLGHPSFGYLQHLFPTLFSELCVSDFKCETCILAKSHRVPYPLRMNKSEVPCVGAFSEGYFVWFPLVCDFY